MIDFDSYIKMGVPGGEIECGFIEFTYPDSPKHPKQKYRLTEKGKALLK